MSCGDQSEPVDEWEVIWDDTIATVAEASTPDATQPECQEMLGYLRAQRTVLAPVPIADLETPVDGWFLEAESIFFECDLGGEKARDALLTLEALEGEVEVVLEVEG